MPQSVLNYVIHSHDSVVLGDAMVEHQFAGDPVVLERGLRSLLCIPLLHQGKLIGLIYLENNLITDAFTQKRIKVIRLLCSQAAISLDNSRLYAEAADYARTLEQKVMERTAALEEANQELHRLATLDSLT
ncbi:MAG: GAF domain-containing protein, partial [Cyanobacteria bacterium J06623_5]